MTDEHIDDVVSRAATVHDADLERPAVHAAVTAALDSLIGSASTRSSSAPSTLPSGPRTVAPDDAYAPHRRRSSPRTVLTAAAVLVVLAAGVAGFAYAGADRSPDRSETSPATGPEGPSTTPVPPPTTRPPATFPGTSTTTVPAAELPAVVNPPPDPADAPPADAPFAERFAFAVRLAYLANVQHEVWFEADGSRSMEFWRDQASGSDRALLFEPGGGPDGGAVAMDTASDADGPCGGGGPPSAGGPELIPDRLSSDVSSGALVEDGRETIDGRDAIRLRYTNEFEGGSMWVDATTLWPIRETTREGYLITHEFLPRTAESIANLDNGQC